MPKSAEIFSRAQPSSSWLTLDEKQHESVRTIQQETSRSAPTVLECADRATEHPPWKATFAGLAPPWSLHLRVPQFATKTHQANIQMRDRGEVHHDLLNIDQHCRHYPRRLLRGLSGNRVMNGLQVAFDPCPGCPVCPVRAVGSGGGLFATHDV